jgi:flagellar export protein FliJ
MKLPKYRLEPVLEQREKEKHQAEMALVAAQEALEQEIVKLKELEAEKEKKLEEIELTREKREQKARDGELTVEQSRQYKLYIQRLHNEAKEMDVVIYKQARAVERAEENVSKAKDHLLQCAKEYEAMAKHKEKWLEERKTELEKKEQKLMEEIGMGQFFKRKRGN